jgi:hypothetical protein
MLAVVRQFGNLSLEFPKVPLPVYFDLLGLTMLVYPTTWAIPFLLGLTIIFAGVIGLGTWRKRLSLGGLTAAASALLLSALTVPLLLLALTELVILVGPTPQLASALTGDTLLSNSLRWGSAILTVGATWLCFGLFRKTLKKKSSDLVIGTYLALYLGACGTSLALPGLSYIFVWPLLVGLIALFIRLLFDRKPPQAPGWPAFLAGLAAGVVAVLLFVPDIVIAVMSIDIRSIYFVPVFVAAWLGFLFAPLEIYFSRIEPSGKKAN